MTSGTPPGGRRLRVLLVEANEMGKWVGGNAPSQVHVVPIGLLYVAASAREAGTIGALFFIHACRGFFDSAVREPFAFELKTESTAGSGPELLTVFYPILGEGRIIEQPRFSQP